MLKFSQDPNKKIIVSGPVEEQGIALVFSECLKIQPAFALQMSVDFEVETLEGTMKGSAGDYLMRGVNDELYPCAQEIFQKTYRFTGMLATWIDKSLIAAKIDPEYVRVVGSLLQIQLQNGPVKEVGKNGEQITVLLEIFHKMVTLLDEQYPCKENVHTLAHVEEAIRQQKLRTKNREERGVEGTNQE